MDTITKLAVRLRGTLSEYVAANVSEYISDLLRRDQAAK